MKIYIDVLMITNMILTFVYLQCVSVLTHRKVSKVRTILCCIIGGVGSLVVIVNSDSFIISLIITIVKIALSLLIVLIAFRCGIRKKAIKYIFLYFFINIMFTGICFIIWNVTNSRLIYINNYTIYFDISLLSMIIAVICIYIIITVYEFTLRHFFSQSNRYKAIYTVGDYQIELNAVADSGNKLCDPFTGTPVVIFCCNEMFDHFNLDNEDSFIQSGFRLTPCSTINGRSVIPITSKGRVTIADGENNWTELKCCVGITRNDKQKARAIFDPLLLQ